MAPPDIACPRCGYDLSGAVAAWEGSCPLTGVCSECGLELWWGDVLNPSLTVPKWSFEHAIARRLSRLAGATGAALAPWMLWRSLRMEHPVVSRRLVWMTLAWLAAAHLILGAGQAALSHHATLAVGIARSSSHAAALAAPSLLWPYSTRNWMGAGWGAGTVRSPLSDPALALLALMALAPVAFLLLPDSLRQANVRRRHVVRGGAYSMAIVPVLAALWAPVALAAGYDIDIWRWRWWEYVPLLGAAIFALALGWQWLYWWTFVRRYLRLPHSSLVATVVLVVPALALLTAIIVFNGPDTVHWLNEWWRRFAGAVVDALSLS